MAEEAADSDMLACVLPFDTDEPAFAHGFEAGRVWAALQGCDGELEEIVHAANTEMVLRMGEALNRPVVGEPLDDVWTRVRFGAPAGAVQE